MTVLTEIIRHQIAQTGPISVAEYMALCLGHPEHGYYRKQDPLGAAGDFTTAPEISQMFGEMIGLSLAQCWMDAGRPDPFRLVELGPGRGTLMVDLLRAAAAAPGFRAAADLWLVETSPALRARQAAALPDAAPNWADSYTDIPDGPVFLIANEFFDALPIRQLQRVGGVWRERVVGLEGDRLTFGLGGVVPGDAAEEGAMREFSPTSTAIMAEIAAHIAAHGGAALVIDYGYASTPPMGGDTFQAMRGHAFTDPLAAPGDADLTAHVDFAALTDSAGSEVRVSAVTTQGSFLQRLGIATRANVLCAATSGDISKVNAINSDLRRLTDPDQMGSLFKVLGVTSKNIPAPPGLETCNDDIGRHSR